MPKRKAESAFVKKLNYKHRKFADAYFASGFRNVANAAIEAGYSEKSAHVTGSRILKDAKVRAYLDKLMSEQVMSRDETLYRLGEYGRGDLREFIGLSASEIAEHPRAWLIKKVKTKTRKVNSIAIDEYVEFELNDPQAALNSIAKYHGLLKDGVTVNINVQLVMQVVEALEAAGIDPVQTFEKMIQKAQERARNGN